MDRKKIWKLQGIRSSHLGNEFKKDGIFTDEGSEQGEVKGSCNPSPIAPIAVEVRPETNSLAENFGLLLWPLASALGASLDPARLRHRSPSSPH